MKPEALQQANSDRKKQRSGEGKRQGTVVDLPFVLIIGPKKAQQKQDCCHRSHDSQSE